MSGRVTADWDTSPFTDGVSDWQPRVEIRKWEPEAETIRRYTTALLALSPEDQRVGELATAYLKQMFSMEDAGHVRWDNRLKDWVMTWSHPAYTLRHLPD